MAVCKCVYRTADRATFPYKQSQYALFFKRLLLTHLDGGLCGSGTYMLLVKNKQRWIVKKKFTAWVS